MKQGFTKKAFRFLSSMKLAIVILTTIATLSGLSTFIIQGESRDFYTKTLSGFGDFLFSIGFTDFFKSYLFLSVLVLFFINMLFCTIKRLKKEFTKAIPFRIGPDIIHIGLLMLLIGGSINLLSEQEGSVMLKPGKHITLEEYKIILDDFKFIKYNNGAPKDWISTVTVTKGSEVLIEKRDIEVNKPLRFKGYGIFQSRYKIIPTKDGERLYTGLLIKKEPAYYLNLIALIVMLLGLSITYIHKFLKRNK